MTLETAKLVSACAPGSYWVVRALGGLFSVIAIASAISPASAQEQAAAPPPVLLTS